MLELAFVAAAGIVDMAPDIVEPLNLFVASSVRFAFDSGMGKIRLE